MIPTCISIGESLLESELEGGGGGGEGGATSNSKYSSGKASTILSTAFLSAPLATMRLT
jgi:hypothetical protein